MQNLSFTNRIALFFVSSTGILIFLIFFVTYHIVSTTVNNRVDNDLRAEAAHHFAELTIADGKLNFRDVEEWKEREHNELNANPVLVQIVDPSGNLIEKSPNLKKEQLHLKQGLSGYQIYNQLLKNDPIRQAQIPFYNGKTIIGYLLVALSSEGANMVLKSLKYVLMTTYPFSLLILFFLAKFFASRSIRPVKNIIQTTKIINKENLSTRINLPENKDELYQLSETINGLLDRIEHAVQREKKFTSDASHELRTPLAIIKGTLEVLIRKTRSEQEYKEKINYCIKESDRLNVLIDQLLLIARQESDNLNINRVNLNFNALLIEINNQYSAMAQEKNIRLLTDCTQKISLVSDYNLLLIILGNLVSNALKFSPENSTISISALENEKSIVCEIKDQGMGIPEKELNMVFEQFYRSSRTEQSTVEGSGLGLSIVKKLCDLLKIELKINNNNTAGTTASLYLPKKI